MDTCRHVASIQYVGLNVHKDSADIAAADCSRDGEVCHVGKLGGDLAALDKALRRLISQGHPPCPSCTKPDRAGRDLAAPAAPGAGATQGARVGWQKAVVALANKNARILWAVLTRGAVFDPHHVGEPPTPRCAWPRPAMP